MQVVFIAAILPPLLVIIAWAAITAIRICIPERRTPPVQHRIWIRQQLEDSRESIPVGAHEIRENQRRLLRKMQQAYAHSGAKRVIDIWADELWTRRN
ncbi:MAG TPA: hypothetical protein VFG50_12015 [Rhodothermales bacterium]|nr:hypothetical protein [Rhodothermales bacterium]